MGQTNMTPTPILAPILATVKKYPGTEKGGLASNEAKYELDMRRLLSLNPTSDLLVLFI